jgi:Co/Zn/Cd efflux system component
VVNLVADILSQLGAFSLTVISDLMGFYVDPNSILSAFFALWILRKCLKILKFI